MSHAGDKMSSNKLKNRPITLQTVFGSTHFNISKLKATQTALGKIQDSNALLQNLDRYLSHKKNRRNAKLLLDEKKKLEKNKKMRIQAEFKILSASPCVN